VVGLGAAPVNTLAGDAKLAWQGVSGAAGYRVSYGVTSGKYTKTLDVGNKTSTTVTGLTDGTRYFFAVRAYKGSLTSGYSNEISTVVGALVAAYGFNESSGTTVSDSSGKGNHGTLLNATRRPKAEARHGQGALLFNGSNSLVTIPDKSSLDLTKGMTLSAWVYPTVDLSGWKSLIEKERTGGFAYALHANSDANRPTNAVHIGTSYEHLKSGNKVPRNRWTHLAATYDGSTQRLFVNGVQVGSRSQTGSLSVTANPLRIGGNTVLAGRYFKGLIDDVRVHNRALIAAEIAAMKDQPVVVQ
jgi:hypothetical protein